MRADENQPYGSTPISTYLPAPGRQAKPRVSLVRAGFVAGLPGACSRAAFAFLLLLAAFAAQPAGAAPATLTLARQVHELPPEQAARAVPVHLVATVTYYQPKGNILFVSDASGAVFIRTDHPYPLHVGDLLEVTGSTDRSFRSVVATDPHMRLLGTSHRFATRAVDYRQLVSGAVDCQPVAVDGTVRSASLESQGTFALAQLEVSMPGGIVQAYIQNYDGLDLSSLIDAEVHLSGVAGSEFNARFQTMRPLLYLSSARQLRVLSRPQVKPLDLPLTDIDKVVETRFVLNQSRRVRVHGAVTAYEPGHSLVIQHGAQGLLVLTRQVQPIPLGAVVDVIGFADDHSYSAVLEDAQFFPTGQLAPVAPQPVSYDEAMSGAYSDSLISLRGTVLSQLHGERSDTLVVMVDRHPVNMVMRRKGRPSLPDLPAGTLVVVTGICSVTPSDMWNKPLLFRLDLREDSDLDILARTSWWNVQHLLMVVGTLLALFLLILVWVVVLRRRVANQTGQIERSIRVERQRSRLLEEISSDTPLGPLLEDICASIGALVPGLRCSCTLVEEPGTVPSSRQLPGSSSSGEPAYESVLRDEKGRRLGVFRAQSPTAVLLSGEDRDALAVGASLAKLAVNQRRMYQEMNYCSTHDQLTALPNRRLADARLDAAIREAAETGTCICVAYIDVDHFKQVNDQYGHKTGDLYLQQIASRLGAKVRAGDLLARIGGDEFLLIATALPGLEESQACKRRLQTCFEDSFALEGVRIRGAASIGLAVFPLHGATPEALKRHADADMYSAKHRHKQLEPPPRPEAAEIFSPAELAAALEADRFRLFYQPQFSAQGRLRGLEALIRLDDPILGIVTPDAFIGVAERSDFVFAMGAWVLRQALADAAHWRVGVEEDVRVIVNVSARQVEQTGFADQVALALLDSGMPAGSLELEITERCVVRDLGNAVRQLSSLRALGVRVSLDDFGTDQSCLNVLHKLPVDTLKIDRSFVRVMRSEPKVLRVIEAIVQLGQTMGKRIVAEGVESEDEIAELLQLGDMDFQGFAFSRPLPPEKIQVSLEGWRKGVTTAKG